MRYLLLCATFLATPALAQTDAGADPGSAEIVVTAQRLNAARETIDPSIGASEANFDRTDLEVQPGGLDRGLKGILLQAPGVSQDADGDGEVHVRNEHGNVQYRLNGVTIPEGFGGFGAMVDPRVAESVEVLTGALPAQYGFRTTGVVNLTTRAEAFDFDGDVGIYGGSHGTYVPSFTLRGPAGRLNYFISGSYQQNDLGIANPTAESSAIHDRSKQWRGFAYLSYILGDNDRLSAFGGTAIGRQQMPNRPDLPVEFHLNGRTTFDSALLDQNQKQESSFAVLSYQHSSDGFNLVAAPFVRFAKAEFIPDPSGGTLMFNGVETALQRSSWAWGVQADAAVELGASHTLRSGLFFQQDLSRTNSLNRVFAVDALGNQTSDVPITIPVGERLVGRNWSVYVQDEWKLAESVTLNYGLRFDHSQGLVSENQLSPRIGLVWQPDSATVLHMGYARYFTPPPLSLIGLGTVSAFDGTTNESAVKTSDPVLPQREHMFDIGVQRQFWGRLTLGIDTYLKLADNLLDEAELGGLLIQAPFNYAKAANWGVEFSASYHKGPLQAYFNLARGDQKAKDIVSNQFLFDPTETAYIKNSYIFTDHSQKWTASGGASLNLDDGIGKLQPGIDFIYGSGLRAEDPAGVVPNGGKMRPYLQVNAGIAQVIGHGEHALTVRLDVINLFDTVYLLHDGSGVGAGQPQYGPRRGIFAGVRQEF